METLLSTDNLAKLDEFKGLKPTTQDGKNVLLPFISIFQEFLITLQSKFDNFKEEMLESSKCKDEKIRTLEVEVQTLKNKVLKNSQSVNTLMDRLDNEDAYIRRETLILSGELTNHNGTENNCSQTVIVLIKDNLNIIIHPQDISVAHRLGPKSSQQGPDKRSIATKFCRRDLKRQIILAARKKKVRNFYINESLTPLRSKISFALRKAKKAHPTKISGITSIDGRVLVWTKNSSNGENDIRHAVNTLEGLEDFCRRNLGLPATNFLV